MFSVYYIKVDYVNWIREGEVVDILIDLVRNTFVFKNI